MIDYGEFTLKFDTEGIAGLYEWIDDNFKCIKKGSQPHPFADVLHEWLEGTKVECRYLANDSFEWKNNLTLPSLDYEYRIKAYEPVWEYQFVYIKADNTAELTQFYTNEEAEDCHQWIKLEETKRERK